MKKNGFMLLAGFALLLGLFLIPKTNTEAASKVSLSTGTTYTSYDVTGDGKTDSLRLAGGRYCGYGAYEYLYVYVNNQLAYTVYDSDGCIYKGNILTLNNGKTYLYLQGSGDSDDGPRYLLEYDNSSGKFKVLVNFVTMFEKYGYHINVANIKVSKNKITFRTMFVCYNLGDVYFDLVYKYQSGNLKQVSQMNIKKIDYSGTKLTANKKITVYKASSCKKKSFTLKSGQKVKILKLHYSGGKLTIKVRSNGKTGWIKAIKKYPKKKPFKEIVYTG